jgi:Raf kinase inhibitor-like YbhB/YbcL family protein
MMRNLALFIAALFSIHSARAEFRLLSSDVSAGKAIGADFIFNSFGCTGKNVSPQLKWTGAPAGSKSFAVLVHDPDAPTGGAGWWHWLVYNIPASSSELAQGAGNTDSTTLPVGAMQNATDFGSAGWGGPCPPVGDKPHHYIFTVHALKLEKLDIPAGASASLVGFMVNANSIGKAKLIATFGRSK